MNNQQIQNAIALCRHQPLSKILQLFSLCGWRDAEVRDMSAYFKCDNTKEAVALRLMKGY